MKNRMAWGLAVVLTVVVLSGVGLLGVRLRPYWVAAHDGEFANLRGAPLSHAQLRGASLGEAHLEHADLFAADLRQTNLTFAILQDADLNSADLTGASLWGADLRNADLRGAKLGGANLKDIRLSGARYNRFTRWPAGFAPKHQGAAEVP